MWIKTVQNNYFNSENDSLLYKDRDYHSNVISIRMKTLKNNYIIDKLNMSEVPTYLRYEDYTILDNILDAIIIEILRSIHKTENNFINYTGYIKIFINEITKTLKVWANSTYDIANTPFNKCDRKAKNYRKGIQKVLFNINEIEEVYNKITSASAFIHTHNIFPDYIYNTEQDELMLKVIKELLEIK